MRATFFNAKNYTKLRLNPVEILTSRTNPKPCHYFSLFPFEVSELKVTFEEKITDMKLRIEDLDDESRFRHILTVSYNDIAPFVFDYLRRKTAVTLTFWSFCLVFLGLALIIRINISGYFAWAKIFSHTLLGTILLPVAVVPLHEFMHAIPFLATGAKNIRAGMDLRQFIFYVTVHRKVISRGTFIIVASIPFIVVSAVLLFLIYNLPGLWKWSLSLFLFVHTTMCAGDFAMLNLYFINRKKKILSWDDADKKEAYFYEEF